MAFNSNNLIQMFSTTGFTYWFYTSEYDEPGFGEDGVCVSRDPVIIDTNYFGSMAASLQVGDVIMFRVKNVPDNWYNVLVLHYTIQAVDIENNIVHGHFISI